MLRALICNNLEVFPTNLNFNFFSESLIIVNSHIFNDTFPTKKRFSRAFYSELISACFDGKVSETSSFLYIYLNHVCSLRPTLIIINSSKVEFFTQRIINLCRHLIYQFTIPHKNLPCSKNN